MLYIVNIIFFMKKDIVLLLFIVQCKSVKTTVSKYKLYFTFFCVRSCKYKCIFVVNINVNISVFSL